MKFFYWIFCVCILILSCKKNEVKTITPNPIKKDSNKTNSINQPTSTLHFSKAEDYILVGKFYSTNKIDTLRFKYYSFLSEKYLDSIPKPIDNDYDSCAMYYQKNSIGLINQYPKNNFGFEPCFGFYFLENIGDNNKDGLDEIALVEDFADFSNLNSCKIFQFCHSDWKLLFNFKINEMSSFTYTSKEEEKKYEHSILDGLEKRGKYWYYADYLETFNDTIDGLPNFKKLKLEKCK